MTDYSIIINTDASLEELTKIYRRESLKCYKNNDMNKLHQLNSLYKTVSLNKTPLSNKKSKIIPSSINSENTNLDILKTVDISITQSYNGTSIPIEINRTITNNNVIRKEIETIYINIYRGIDNNEIITVMSKGNIINNTVGNVLVCIRLNNTTKFIRNGIDLILNKEISLKEALCGFTFTYTHINNQKYNIVNHNNIIFDNYEKVIEKLGMVRDNLVGNLIIKFKLQFPSSLTTKQISVIKEYF